MQRFRTARPSGDIRTFQYIADEGITEEEGLLYMINGTTVGVLLLDIQYNADGSKADKEIVDGDSGVLVYHIEKIMLDKITTTGSAFLPGDKIYWNDVQGDPVSPTYGGAYLRWIGTCVWPASDTDTQVMADLKGDKTSITEPL